MPCNAATMTTTTTQTVLADSSVRVRVLAPLLLSVTAVLVPYVLGLSMRAEGHSSPTALFAFVVMVEIGCGFVAVARLGMNRWWIGGLTAFLALQSLVSSYMNYQQTHQSGAASSSTPSHAVAVSLLDVAIWWVAPFLTGVALGAFVQRRAARTAASA